MKGIVFNLLERVVSDAHGDTAWDGLLRAAGLEGAYTSLGSYPDEDLLKLVEAATSALDQSAEDIVRWYGRHALPLLAQAYPQFFLPHGTTRAFLLTLNEVIHTEVRKLYPGADVPMFDYDPSDPDSLVMSYASRRRLCAFGEGLIQGAAAHYGERVDIAQPACVHRGGDRCEFQIRFPKPAE